MDEARQFGKLLNSKTGETLVSLMGPGNSRLDGDTLSEWVYSLSEILIRGWKPEARGGLFGGDFGYGIDYENELFLMHPDYQDDECSCGQAQRATAFYRDNAHSSECFQTIVSRKLEAWPETSPNLLMKRWALEKSMVNRLLLGSNLPAKQGRWTCTCGASQRSKMWSKANPHDFRCKIELPNFWYKPVNFRLSWYKYIGRDMKPSTELNAADMRTMFAACLESIPTDIRQRAEQDTENEAQRETRADAAGNTEQAQSARLFAAMDAMSAAEKPCWTCSKIGMNGTGESFFHGGQHGCVAMTLRNKDGGCVNCKRVTTDLQTRILEEREKRNNRYPFRAPPTIGELLPK